MATSTLATEIRMKVIFLPLLSWLWHCSILLETGYYFFLLLVGGRESSFRLFPRRKKPDEAQDWVGSKPTKKIQRKWKRWKKRGTENDQPYETETGEFSFQYHRRSSIEPAHGDASGLAMQVA
jgi:hypothetical protein